MSKLYIPEQRYIDRKSPALSRYPIHVVCASGHEYETHLTDAYRLGYADCPECADRTVNAAAIEDTMIAVEAQNQRARTATFGTTMPRLPKLVVAKSCQIGA